MLGSGRAVAATSICGSDSRLGMVAFLLFRARTWSRLWPEAMWSWNTPCWLGRNHAPWQYQMCSCSASLPTSSAGTKWWWDCWHPPCVWNRHEGCWIGNGSLYLGYWILPRALPAHCEISHSSPQTCVHCPAPRASFLCIITPSVLASATRGKMKIDSEDQQSNLCQSRCQVTKELLWKSPWAPHSFSVCMWGGVCVCLQPLLSLLIHLRLSLTTRSWLPQILEWPMKPFCALPLKYNMVLSNTQLSPQLPHLQNGDHSSKSPQNCIVTQVNVGSHPQQRLAHSTNQKLSVVFIINYIW